MSIYSRRNRSKEKGFTLIEALVALGIFSTVILITVTIFVTVTGVQRRVASNQKIQDDMRQVFEAVAQQVRLGTIHYNYYSDPDLNGNYNPFTAIDLYPTATDLVTTLALINQNGEYVYFDHDSTGGRGILRYCKLPDASNPATCTWLDITPSQVDISHIQFLISPSADPFYDPMQKVNCVVDADCVTTNGSYVWTSYRCDPTFVPNGRCEYYTDGGNYQPKVRIVIEARGISGKVSEQGHIQLETIISTRSVESKVLNDNGDFPL
ncbi:type II secretion system protein J [Patescibacteria group bacterium]